MIGGVCKIVVLIYVGRCCVLALNPQGNYRPAHDLPLKYLYCVLAPKAVVESLIFLVFFWLAKSSVEE